MVELISEGFRKIYFANYCSGGFIFCALMYLLVLIVPLLIGFTTSNFWILLKTYQEQPTITFNGEYMLKLLTNDNTQKIYTNIIDFPSNTGSVALQIASNSSIDRNTFQPEPQFLNGTLTVGQLGSTIRRIELLLFMQYETNDVLKMAMQSFAYANLYTPSGLSSAQIIGQLNFAQRHPISSGDTYRARYNYSAYYSELGAVLKDPGMIISNNYYRNESIQFDYNSFVALPINYTSLSTTITFAMQVPKYQEYMYQTSILESLKFSWMQYFSIFLIFWALAEFLLHFTMENRVFDSNMISTLPKMKSD